ncbi:MAG: hypothetical protein FJW83_09650, partial [Actinobacteria bacterium]|nr:hypothetical protein [Actinomycetota bacterium]
MIRRIAAALLAVVSSMFLTATPSGATGSCLYVVFNTVVGHVTAFPVPSGAPGTFPVGASPLAMAFSPDGTTGYVTNFADGTVSVVSIATAEILATITVGNGPVGIVVLPNGTRVYVANNVDGTLSVIDTSTNTVVATIPVGSSPAGVVVSPNGARVYVANNVDGTLSVIDT